MSSQDGEEAPNDDSSGDVIFESWSDNDSDLICIDSPEKDDEKKVVEKEKVTKVVIKRDDDSDDCVILDNDSIEDQFGTTSVVRTVHSEEKEDYREEVSLGEQLAMSSEEEE